MRDVAVATHGQGIEAMVANRLTSPTPLLHVEDWARGWAVPEACGIERRPTMAGWGDSGAGLVDAIASHLHEIVGSVGPDRSASSASTSTWPACTGT